MDENRWSEFSDEEIGELARAMYSSEDPCSDLTVELQREDRDRRGAQVQEITCTNCRFTRSEAELFSELLIGSQPVCCEYEDGN
jgi:hypothetical protein